MTGPTTDPLAHARDALERADWQRAHDAALAADDCSGDLQRAADRAAILADSLWWLGQIDECIAQRDAAYHAYSSAGDRRSAGQSAVWLYEHHCFKAQPAIANAWLQRGRRALEGDTECVEFGALALREAESAHGKGRLDEALELGDRMIQLGQRLGSTDLEAEALQTVARVLIDQGHVERGIGHLDEAMLLAVEGRLRPYTTGKIYCSMISACESLGDMARAAEWTDATTTWSRNHPFAFFPGICRVHRASTLTWRGQYALAEQEAAKACDELLTIHLPNAAAAFAEVGDIRRRLGDLGGAEVAFAKAEELCGHSCSGLALLRLAQGRIDAANRIINECLHNAGSSRLSRARLLPAHVQISIAAGATATAGESASELEAISTDYPTDMLGAMAVSTSGRLLLSEGDARGAAAKFRDALTAWRALDVPYEAATAGTLLGQALRMMGDEEGATTAFTSARALFEQLGARLEATQVDQPVATADAPAGLTAREVEVLQLVAAGRSNKAVAAELYLSEKTVSRHVSNIFTKIGVSSRSAATAFAFEQGIVGR